MGMEKIFIAGATGFTGQAMAALNEKETGVTLALHVRPDSTSKHALKGDSRTVCVALDNESALAKALLECSAVVQLIGTTRSKFSQNISYRSVDFETTKQLLKADSFLGLPLTAAPKKGMKNILTSSYFRIFMVMK